jgi:large subunit ribosomal protein L6e
MVKSKVARQNRLKKHKEENKTFRLSKNWYPVTDAKKRITRKCKTPKATKLRSSITPGTILILLSGRFRGRRVVFLKQLKSGLLLVTGPYKLNGVPLRRVNQAYVLATSTKITLGNVAGLDKVNDEFFKRVAVKRTELGEVVAVSAEEKKARVSQERRSAQASIDTEVKKAVDGTAYLKDYLRNRFGLKNGQAAHNLVY